MNYIIKFLNNNKIYSFLTGLSAGMYPMLFYYTKNFNLISSFEHFVFFVITFLCLPVLLIYLSNILINRKIFFFKYLIPFLNFFIFCFLAKTAINPLFQKKITLLILIISIIYSYFIGKYYKKVIIFQILLCFTTLLPLTKIIYANFNSHDIWLNKKESIELVDLKHKPNIYVIQPDGYVNFSKLAEKPYNFPNLSFRNYLENKNFQIFDNFRSNYTSTLLSNVSTFNMKHHYLNLDKFSIRKNIISDNAVLRILKNNGYKTNLITESPYLLLNRPKIGFDKINFDYSDIPYLSTGLKLKKDVVNDLSLLFERKTKKPLFCFIEFFNPGHITNSKNNSKGKLAERENWLGDLSLADTKLKKLISMINENDKNALILIFADHGGFVGLDYTAEIFENKIVDPIVVNSMYSTLCSIKWPEDIIHEGYKTPKTNVNIFRYLFSVLSMNHSLTENYTDDGSYIEIKKGESKGVIKYLNDNGELVGEKISD